jgi:hypothetical protein
VGDQWCRGGGRGFGRGSVCDTSQSLQVAAPAEGETRRAGRWMRAAMRDHEADGDALRCDAKQRRAREEERCGGGGGGGVERQRRAGDTGHWSLLSSAQGQSLSIVSGPSRAVAVSMTCAQQNWKGLVGPSVLDPTGPPQPIPAVHHRLFHNFIHVSEHLFHINSINYEMPPPRCKPADAHYRFPRPEHSDPQDLGTEDLCHS